ncbi:MAG: SDR family NAD(P)-dependent oxidoreductase [Paracoccaceae bacterium]|nr:SDR family NAD(P)-dependent oxidoreductase [Paracoccaceae bacterium]MDG1737042.1 SDR family NAD(P)-dependent oxidoreductase [Paracoccaceae bacterium]MDG2258378.1 SDR family NAD(P)-dependent oxidoreductase [Paracoccaceae bacterium]
MTGSSRGIGLGLARSFLHEGANVVLTGRSGQDMSVAEEMLATEFSADRVCAFVGDIGVSSIRDELAEFLSDDGLDHLVCNIGSGKSVPVLEEDDDEWRRMLEINLVLATQTVSSLLPILAKPSGGRGNKSLTFIGSICGQEAIGCPLAYSSAKAALRAYARNLVRPLSDKGIRVNTVTPGNVMFEGSTWETKLAEDALGVREMLRREVALNRLGTIEEIAASVVFLASEKASFITGTNLIVDGGQTRGI